LAILTEDIVMGRFSRLYVIGCILLGFIGFAVAQTSITNPASTGVINKHNNAAYNFTVTIAATPTSISFTDRQGRALSLQPDGAWIEISGYPRWFKAAKALALPADLEGVSGWPIANGANLFVYTIYHASTGVNLCVSDEANRTTKGAVAAAAFGYMKCGGTTATGSTVRMIGRMTADTSADTVSAYTEFAINAGQLALPVWGFGAVTTAYVSGGAIAYPVNGMTSTRKCMTEQVAMGGGSIVAAVPTTGAINITIDPTPVGTPSTTINYICW
jgi:hypothetical protein